MLSNGINTYLFRIATIWSYTVVGYEPWLREARNPYINKKKNVKVMYIHYIFLSICQNLEHTTTRLIQLSWVCNFDKHLMCTCWVCKGNQQIRDREKADDMPPPPFTGRRTPVRCGCTTRRPASRPCCLLKTRLLGTWLGEAADSARRLGRTRLGSTDADDDRLAWWASKTRVAILGGDCATPFFSVCLACVCQLSCCLRTFYLFFTIYVCVYFDNNFIYLKASRPRCWFRQLITTLNYHD
jgi:hypothetical protein